MAKAIGASVGDRRCRRSAWLLYSLLPANCSAARCAACARRAYYCESLPGLSACWIETGKTFSNFPFGSTAGSILVRHPAGDLLIDTGNSSHFNDEIRGYPFGTWFKLRLLAGQLKPDVPLPQLLRQVKEDPAKLRWVILSHAHLDHSGGLMDLPRLIVLLSQEESQFANDASVQAKGFVIPAHVAEIPCAWRAYFAFSASALRNVRRERRPLSATDRLSLFRCADIRRAAWASL